MRNRLRVVSSILNMITTVLIFLMVYTKIYELGYVVLVLVLAKYYIFKKMERDDANGI